jgi:hypothetical protein
MEHVLRQCMIALRLAERAGLDDKQRSVVYYTCGVRKLGFAANSQVRQPATS